jgi:hypothetical protein
MTYLSLSLMPPGWLTETNCPVTVTVRRPTTKNPVKIQQERFLLSWRVGRAIAQAVSHRLPIAAARVRAQVRSCGICGGQSDIVAGSLRVLRFPLPILILTAPHSSFIIRGWYNRPVSGRPHWLIVHGSALHGGRRAVCREVHMNEHSWRPIAFGIN